MSQTDGIGTWKWNEKPNIRYISYWNSYDATLTNYRVDFVSDNRTFVGINTGSTFDGDYITPYSYNVGWVGGYDTPLNTIEIKTAPPAEFLTILQLNAEYQSGGGRYER